MSCQCGGSCAACSDLARDPCGPGPCEDRERFTQLTPTQAGRTLAQRVMRAQDRARQTLTRLGFRPYNVNLVWVRWTGIERGGGYEILHKRIALVPNPELVDLSSVSMSPVATGVLPMGSIRLDEISGCYTSDQLMGRLFGDDAIPTPQPYDFYYEVYEDGRSGSSDRMKFRPSSHATRLPYGWQITLERIGRDGPRDGDVAEPVP